MESISSTGAKGGVGKSTFAILRAIKESMAGKKVVLCDCDVECPNDHLILGIDLGEKSTPVYVDRPVLDEEKCAKCGICSQKCNYNAIFWLKGKPPTFVYDLCSGCGVCELVCPQNAIKSKKEKCGEFFINKVNDKLWLVTGMSKPGIAETSPVVERVKEEAISLSKSVSADILIVDTAPGTHCSVIQALIGSEKAYAVTEPTPLGAHDLGLILELLKKIKVPAEIVLNKADVGKRELIEKISSEYGVKITKEIPYSEELVKAYCEKDLGRVVDLI